MPKGGGASDPSDGYVVLTADALGLKLVNRAEGGSGAANATKTMEAARPAGRRDAVVLHTGMNDIFRRGADAVTRGRLAIRHFLEGTEDAGLRVVVLECQPASWSYTPPGRNLQSAYEAWNDMLRDEVSAAHQVRLLDTCESWDPQQFTSAKRYHPDDEGHARMAADLAALLARS
jgi:lysophospholipase L1-like esterase